MNVLNTIKHRVSQEKTEVYNHVFEKCEVHQISFLDVKTAIINGNIYAVLTHDPRYTRYIICGTFDFFDILNQEWIERELFVVCILQNKLVTLKTIYLDYFDEHYEI